MASQQPRRASPDRPQRVVIDDVEALATETARSVDAELATESERGTARAAGDDVVGDGIGTAPVGEQETLWDPSTLSGLPAEISDELNKSRHTTDSLFLADVPIAHTDETALRMFEFGAGARVPGKVLFSKGPHPTFVLHQGRVTRRDELSREQRTRSSAIMVDVVTCVLYARGPIKSIHHDVMNVLLERKREDWLETGSQSPIVQTTKTEIAATLKLDLNGALAREIELALETLRGLSVTKIFREPTTGGTGAGQVGEKVESMGGIVVNYAIERGAGGSGARGGRRTDVIAVELNHALVRAMTGQLGPNERQWLLRSLDFDRNQRHKVAWKRQLDRMVDARLDTTGHFQMPLFELWTARLGKPETDFATAAKARKVRFLVRNTLKEWESTGYLDNVQITTRTGARLRGRRAEALTHEPVNVALSLNDQVSRVQIELPRSDSPLLEEWVSCDAGPGFYAGRRHKRPAFAREIIAATVDEPEQREALLERYTAEFIIDAAYERLKRILREVGERRERLTVAQWLTPTYPVPTRPHQVRMVAAEFERRARAARTGDVYRQLDAPLADRRAHLVAAHLAKQVAASGHTIAGWAEGGERPEHAGVREAVECFRVAFERQAEALGKSRLIDAVYRSAHPEVQREYDLLIGDATKIAVRAAAHLLWYKRLAKIVATKLGEDGPIDRDTAVRIGKRYPKAMAVCLEMEVSRSEQWEVKVGQILQRRLAEALCEEEELDQLERTAKARGMAADTNDG